MKIKTKLKIISGLSFSLAFVLAGFFMWQAWTTRALGLESVLAQTLLVIFVIALLIVLGAVSLMAQRKIVHPIRELYASIRRVESGQLGEAVSIGGRDEIGDLARAFNQMSQRIRQSHTTLEDEIKQRRQAEHSLRESEKRYRRLVDTMNEGVVMLDAGGRLEYANDRLLEMLGRDRGEIIGRPLAEFVLDERNRARLHHFLKTRDRRDSSNHEIAWLHRDGHAVFSLLSPVPVFGEDGSYEGSFTVVTDITQRRKAEAALFNEKERLAVTLRNIGEGVITTDTDGKVVLINEVAETICGWSVADAEGSPVENIMNLVDPKTDEPVKLERMLSNGVSENMDYKMVTQVDNETRTAETDTIISITASPILDDRGKHVGGVLVFRDVTAQRNREEESLKGQKLESVGLLAGGIAHDFNNILTVILGNVSLARAVAGENQDILELLHDTERASVHARYLTQQLLTFSKGGEPVKETTALGKLIPEAVGYVLRGTDAELKINFPNSLWDAEVDVGQIFQVFQNLVINASEAMLDGGVITISAENRTVFQDDALPLASGPYICISIEDNGCGIREEYLSKIFDPYFTTKQGGTGLGLATTYSIVKKHGGYIAVDSTPGKGTTFNVYLPARRDRQSARARKLQTEITEGEGRILVMDDDRAVRELLRRMLPTVGYEVEIAADGQTAIDKFLAARKTGKPFNAAILDLMVPGGMGGRLAAKKILEQAPDSRLIVSSGYSNDPIMAKFKDYGFTEVVSKPYNIQELSSTLNRVIKG